MAVQFQRAQRKKAKLRLALAGPAGRGKTYSALLIGFGLGGRIALIDTERGSGELYADLGEYDVCTLEAPFTPEKYVEAIQAAQAAGYDVIIIDSLSHAWAGPGGVLDIHGHTADRAGNSWSAWRQVTPRHNELVDAMLLSSCHIIATMRSKMEHMQVMENGKAVIKKVGMNPIQRDGMEYEFTVFLDLDHNHTASASKDRTRLFDGQVFRPTQDTGRKLREWLESGSPAQTPAGRQRNLVVVEGKQAAEHPANNSAGDPFGTQTAPGNNQARVQNNSFQPEQGAPNQFPSAPGQQAKQTKQNHSPSKATPAQLRKIFATAGEAGVGETMLGQLIEQETGKTSASELTKPEASRVIDVLLGMSPPLPNHELMPPPTQTATGNRMRLF